MKYTLYEIPTYMYDTLDCVKVVVHVQKRMCELMGVSVLLYALV